MKISASIISYPEQKEKHFFIVFFEKSCYNYSHILKKGE